MNQLINLLLNDEGKQFKSQKDRATLALLFACHVVYSRCSCNNFNRMKRIDLLRFSITFLCLLYCPISAPWLYFMTITQSAQCFKYSREHVFWLKCMCTYFSLVHICYFLMNLKKRNRSNHVLFQIYVRNAS